MPDLPAAPQEALTEVFRARRRADCDERALVLMAVGISSELAWLGDSFALLVPVELAASALTQLRAYSEENRPAPKRMPAMPLHEDAWVGAAAYVLLLVGIAHFAVDDLFDAAWFPAGELVSGRVKSGEWWRVVTALTLHADSGHLVANLGFGALFGYLLGQLIGPGVAWASILLAGAAGNLLDALLMPADHQVIGASTAVFATLGLLAAYSWRQRADRGIRWPYRWAPLIAALALLALTGTAGQHTDVLAHLTGFLAGSLLGAVYGSFAVALSGRAVLQRLAGAAALLVVAAAWARALLP